MSLSDPLQRAAELTSVRPYTIIADLDEHPLKTWDNYRHQGYKALPPYIQQQCVRLLNVASAARNAAHS